MTPETWRCLNRIMYPTDVFWDNSTVSYKQGVSGCNFELALMMLDMT